MRPKGLAPLSNQDLYLGLVVLALFAIGIHLYFKETSRKRWRRRRHRDR